MTRVNLVPPSELCDQHLIAELHEVVRIPWNLLSGTLKPYDIPETYRLGKGHVKFFIDKQGWLRLRYLELLKEAYRRGFNCKDHWPFPKFTDLYTPEWTPRPMDIEVSRARIMQKLPKKPRYTRNHA